MVRHNEKVLGQLREYDSFLDSLTTICDMGCGTGEDIAWWATLESRDDPPRLYNYNCFAVDSDAGKLSQVPNLPNIKKVNKDFTEQFVIPVKADLMWSHDSLQYSHNPLETLRNWNEQMNIDGMLVLSVPQHNGVEYNRYYSRTHNHCYYNHTPISLIYMLAVNGFDCRDAYLLKEFQDPWIHLAVYKSNIAPIDPKTTSLYDLADLDRSRFVMAPGQSGHPLSRHAGDFISRWRDGDTITLGPLPARVSATIRLTPGIPGPGRKAP